MLKSKQEGWVKVSITGENDFIICTIEDNGVGRKSAQEIRSKKDPERKSLGFKITAQRIDLLNSLYKERFNIKYFDINNPDDTKGTKVVIRIPKSIMDENDVV
jgi:sensor histidine kinase YesM